MLGEEHPSTLTSAGNLAHSLCHQGKYADAEGMLQATLAARRRVLGSTHPETLATARGLENVRSAMRAEQPTRIGGKAMARGNYRIAGRSSSTRAPGNCTCSAVWRTTTITCFRAPGFLTFVWFSYVFIFSF